MSKVKKALVAQTTQLGERQVRVIANTGAVDRTGEQVVLAGVDLTGFRANPIILYQHDPDVPVGRASNIQVTSAGIEMTIDFAPQGISAKADEVCGLVKAGVLSTVSIGFDPTKAEPMDPRDAGKKNAPLRYLTCDLMETSFVSIPADKGAVVTQRTYKAAQAEKWTCAAAKDLEIDTEGDWNGRDAAERILDDAGFNGENPDPDKAKKGFLAYDSANPTLKGGYKLPFADIQKGKLVAVASGIRASASRLPDADIPDDVAKEARAVLDAYEALMDKGNQEAKTAGARRIKSGGKLVVKDLSDVGTLAYLLDYLGWVQAGTRIETALEGDGSTMPEQLAQIMQDLGAALIAMTTEEVAEAIAEAQGSLGQEEDFSDLADADCAIVMSGATPAVRRFRAAVIRAKTGGLRTKSGKRISSATADVLRDAMAHHEKGMDAHRAAMKAHTKAANAIQGLLDDDTDQQEAQSSGGSGDGSGDGADKSAVAARQKAFAALRAKSA